MIISNEKTLRDIQSEFHKKFPHLKIEFYTEPHQVGKGSPVGETLEPEQTIGTVRDKNKTGDLKIVPEMEVGELERLFTEKFGLNVQVFRRSGNLWMQTSATDSWTLEKQNRKGGSSEMSYREMHDDDQ